MRRWIVQAGATSLDSLVMQEAPIPEPGPGEVRIKVHAVSINYRDQIILTGQLGQTLTTDVVPLSDGAGEIDAVGPDVAQ
ncbi:alcohol dehydrogenase catalytic domain-containing protein, partial [uncultured Hymenobacter sp.]|uniref:alcohol dehydrogenase catalytic domain-containing protein n=1 Tax=uncultured Hymenobacter sp. TaxID=170016 RepID=UPI0035C970A8